MIKEIISKLESNSAYGFVKTQLVKDGQGCVTVDELHNAYEDFCAQNYWYPLPQRKACAAFRDNIRDIFHIQQAHDLVHYGRSVRGYRGLRLLKSEEPSEPLANEFSSCDRKFIDRSFVGHPCA